MREILLTQGKVALVDDQDYEWLSQWKWQAIRGHTGIWYAVRCEGPHSQRQYLLMHRVITDAPEWRKVDHKDHDGLNNQRHNLRTCTCSQNLGNRRGRKNTASGYKGVMQNGSGWQARIQCNGRRYCLGTFTHAGDAAQAYNEAALRLFGEFAYVNGLTALA